MSDTEKTIDQLNMDEINVQVSGSLLYALAYDNLLYAERVTVRVADFDRNAVGDALRRLIEHIELLMNRALAIIDNHILTSDRASGTESVGPHFRSAKTLIANSVFRMKQEAEALLLASNRDEAKHHSNEVEKFMELVNSGVDLLTSLDRIFTGRGGSFGDLALIISGPTR